MPNHLANETSPYLLQHKNNPVDWYPWGPEALQRAKTEIKPIFLSIGYSACHWCHVMEHESFENQAIAKLLNASFVCIKVDREERPDLDQIYMNAVQMLTGRGGWPMSVFLTPDLKPFYGGTYFPPHRRGGSPGFDDVLNSISHAWSANRDQAVAMADKLTAAMAQLDQGDSAGQLPADITAKAAQKLRSSFDPTYGGFGGAPKFPSSMALQFLLRYWHRKRDQSALNMVQVSLDHMAAGGIYDHVGGGFARYSVDARWLVPHFEKMLYDNALLAATYLDAFQVSGKKDYARVVRETLDYILRDMTGPTGGFYSTEDADSEGVEGKFYTWTPDQLGEVLDAKAADTFARVYDVTEAGNFEHTNILHLPKTLKQQADLLGRELGDLTAELDASRAKLFATREKRIHPHKDDKVIVAWNGLMIDTMARAGAALDEPRYVQAAAKAADFLLSDLRRKDGRLLHTWRNGQAKLDAYLDDYTCLANGLVSLYEATFESRYLDEAIALVKIVLEKFADPQVDDKDDHKKKGGGFYFTAEDQETLIVRSKDFADNAVPSGNSMAATVLVRLGKITGKQDYLDAAQGAMLPTVELMGRAPVATGQMLIAVDLLLGPTYEMVLAGDLAEAATREVLADLRHRYLPNKVLVLAGKKPSAALNDLLIGKSMQSGTPTLFVCEGHTCQSPAICKKEISHALDELMPHGVFD